MKTCKLIFKLAFLAMICVAMFSWPFGASAQTTDKAPTSSQVATPPSTDASSVDASGKTVETPEIEPSPPPGTTWIQKWLFFPQHAVPKNSNLHSLLNILCAVAIGWAGALAFLAGVRFGFISRDTRAKTMEFLANPPWWRVVDRSLFYCLGGIVAGVFQWAQPDTLAPIQAFVLGATWPSVVTRVMSGGTSLDTATDKLLATPPDKIASPVGKSASDAIVPI